MIFKTFSDTQLAEARAHHEEVGGCLVSRWTTDGRNNIILVYVVGEFHDLTDAGWDEEYLLALAPTYDVTRREAA